ncbi:hypothetical protein KRP22_000116 [Phytophthora ramorum]|nr:hypothetical protein KRP22_12062 [Phytophthora ramorum]
MHQSFIGHAGKVKELAFTKDGKSIVASGESSAICIWQFHGDSSPMSPRAKSGISSYAGIEQQYTADGATFGCDVDDNADSLCLSSIAGTTSKSNFKLSLEADALKLSSGSDCGKVGSVLSDKTDMQGADAPTLAVTQYIYRNDTAFATTIQKQKWQLPTEQHNNELNFSENS